MDNEKIEQLEKLGKALQQIAPFMVEDNSYAIRSMNNKIFSKKYVLKNLLGLSDEELEINEKYLISEIAEIKLKEKRLMQEMRLKEADSDFKEDYSVNLVRAVDSGTSNNW